MTFINSNPGRHLVTTSSDGVFSRLGRSNNISDFASSFGGKVSPSFVSLSPNITIGLSIGNRSTKKSGSSGEGGSSNGGKGKSGSRPHKSVAYRPLDDRSSTNFTFNTGIRSGLIVNPFESSDKYYSTLFVACGSFFPEGDKNSTAQKMLNRLLFNDILFKCQTAVNYKIDSDITAEGFYKYISSVVSALQLYYYVDSVLAYCNSNEIKYTNPGMQELRSQFSSEILSQHALLGEQLKSYPIPKNILDMIRYMYQNFTFVDDPYSPIIRLGFRETLHRGKHFALSPEYYDAVISEITLGSRRIPSILRKTFPDMNISELPLSSSTPIFDKNFISFWVNNCVTHLSKDRERVIHTRTVSNREQEFNYFSMNGDNLDGLFTACHSVFNLQDQCFDSGIWSPIKDITKFKGFESDCRTSLLSFNSKESKLTDPQSLSTLSQSGVYHGVYYNEESKEYIDALMPPIGCLKVQTSSLNMYQQSVSEAIYYLFESPNLKGFE